MRASPQVRHPQRLIDAVRVLGAREQGPGWTVIHGDTHVSNVFLDGDRRPSLTDWQLVQLGHWRIDVGYHIGSGLSPPARERGRELLTHYLERHASEGVDAPTFDAAWLEYRRGVGTGLPVGDHAVRQAGHHRGATSPPRLGRTRSRLVRGHPRHLIVAQTAAISAG